MSGLFADNWKLNQRLRATEDNLNKLLEVIASNDDPEVKRQVLDEIAPKKDNSILSAQKKQVEILKEKWAQYRNPEFTREQISSVIESHKAMISHVKRTREIENFLNNGNRPVQFNHSSAYSEGAPAVLDLGRGISRGLNPISGRYDYILEFSEDIDYADFKTHVTRSLVTDLPNCFVTFNDLMKEAQKRGLTRKQFCKLILEFIKEEYPENTNNLNVNSSPLKDIMAMAYSLIRSYKNIDLINKAIQGFRRRPADTIGIAASNLSGLYKELAMARRPFDSPDKIDRDTEKKVKKTLKDLVAPAIAGEVTRLIDTAEGLGEDISVEEVLEFIVNLEQDKENQIVTDRYLNSKSVNLVALNNQLKNSKTSGKADIHDQVRSSRFDNWKQSGAATVPNYQRSPTPRSSSGGTEKKSEVKKTNKNNFSVKEEGGSKKENPRSRSRRSNNSRSGSRNRSGSRGGEPKSCYICGLPECQNRKPERGSCPFLPQVSFNPKKWCDTCLRLGHYKVGSPCDELVEKRMAYLLQRSKN